MYINLMLFKSLEFQLKLIQESPLCKQSLLLDFCSVISEIKINEWSYKIIDCSNGFSYYLS